MKEIAKKNNQSLAPIPFDKFRKGKSISGPYNPNSVRKQGIYGRGDILAMDLKSI